MPDKPFDHVVTQSFCHYVHNFVSQESANRWASERKGIVLLPASEAFEVGLQAWSTFKEPVEAGE